MPSDLMKLHRSDQKVDSVSHKMRPQDYVQNKFTEFATLAPLLSIVAGLSPLQESEDSKVMSGNDTLAEQAYRAKEAEGELAEEMDARLAKLKLAYERVALFRRKF